LKAEAFEAVRLPQYRHDYDAAAAMERAPCMIDLLI
jgi:hypothetical protein